MWPFVPPSQPPPRPQSYHEPASVTLRSGPKLSTLDFRQRGSGSQVRGGSRPPLFSSRKLEGRTSATPCQARAAGCRLRGVLGLGRAFERLDPARRGAAGSRVAIRHSGVWLPSCLEPRGQGEDKVPLKENTAGAQQPPPLGAGGGVPFQELESGPFEELWARGAGKCCLREGSKTPVD